LCSRQSGFYGKDRLAEAFFLGSIGCPVVPATIDLAEAAKMRKKVGNDADHPYSKQIAKLELRPNIGPGSMRGFRKM
jgi:hypothetical protein